jgi:hypothetical protein
MWTVARAVIEEKLSKEDLSGVLRPQPLVSAAISTLPMCWQKMDVRTSRGFATPGSGFVFTVANIILRSQKGVTSFLVSCCIQAIEKLQENLSGDEFEGLSEGMTGVSVLAAWKEIGNALQGLGS